MSLNISVFKYKLPDQMNDQQLFDYANELHQRCQNLYRATLNFETFSAEATAQLESAFDNFKDVKSRISSIQDIENGDATQDVWNANQVILEQDIPVLVETATLYKSVIIERRKLRESSEAASNRLKEVSENLQSSLENLAFPNFSSLKRSLENFINSPDMKPPIERSSCPRRCASSPKRKCMIPIKPSSAPDSLPTESCVPLFLDASPKSAWNRFLDWLSSLFLCLYNYKGKKLI